MSSTNTVDITMSSTNTVDITTNDSLNQNMVERCNYYEEVYVIEDELNEDNLIFEDNMEGYSPLHRSCRCLVNIQ